MRVSTDTLSVRMCRDCRHPPYRLDRLGSIQIKDWVETYGRPYQANHRVSNPFPHSRVLKQNQD